MTSQVTVTACCAPTKHVEVRTCLNAGFMQGADEVIDRTFLENGESKTVYIYDNRYVVTQELEKPASDTKEGS